MDYNTIYTGDSSLVIPRLIDDNSVDLTVTSPPYDTLRKYNGAGLTWTHEKFKEIANQLYRVTKDGGVVVWVVNDKVDNGSRSGTSMRQALYFMEIGFRLNDTMIWRKTNPMPEVRQPRYQSCFEYMYVFSKGKPKTFNPIMVPCKCSGQSYDSTCKNMGGENGRTKKSFKINSEKIDYNVWDIAVSQNKTCHTAVFPEEIPLRHIRTWTNEGDVVFDPFMGSGTTALAAISLNRRYIGIEMVPEYVELCKQRIEERKNATKD